MISWIIKLCALCAMSALAQMIANQESRSALRMICGLLMLHMTCESADALIVQLTQGDSLQEMLSLLLK